MTNRKDLADQLPSGPQLLQASTLLLLGVAFVRILRISNGSLETALAVLESAGPFDVLIGAAIPLFPVVLPIAAVIFSLVALGWHHEGYHFRALSLVGWVLILIVGALLVTPGSSQSIPLISGFSSATLIFLLTIVLVAMVLSGIHWFLAPRLGSDGDVLGSRMRGWWWATSLAVFVFWSFRPADFDLIRQLDGMWLPPEEITVDSGESLVGYVLDDGVTWVTVLTEEEREVNRFRAESVSQREMCRLEDEELNQPPIPSNVGRPSLPQCSKD